MSSAPDAEPVRSAIPVADLSVIDEALARGGDALKDALKKVRPADVGRDLSRRSLDDCAKLIAAADQRRATAILLAAHPSTAARLLAELEPARAVALLEQMPTDHQSAILGLLDDEPRRRIEGALAGEQKQTLDRLLAYPPSAVGRLMTPKIWRAEVSETAGAALAHLKDDENIEVAVNCYIVDKGVLVGVAALRELAVVAPETPLADVMVAKPIALDEKTERGDAAEIIQVHDFLSLPVIDGQGRLVGAVRVDDLLDAALQKVGVGVLNQGGVAGKVIGDIPYFQTSMLKQVRSRITWLILLFVAETATGTVLRYFDDELAKVVALSFFVPLLIGTGGNAGSQTVSTVIRALALGEARVRDVFRVLGKEATTGVLLGVLLGTIGFFRSLLWGVGTEIALCVAVTLLVICTWANTVGAVIPIIAQRFKIDPTVVSAPAITTLVDATGLFIYLTIAGFMVSKLHDAPKERVVWEHATSAHVITARLDDGVVTAIEGNGKIAYLVYATRDGAGWGEIPAGDLTITDQVAHLSTQVAAGDRFTLEGTGGPIDLTWSATGTLARDDGADEIGVGKYYFKTDGTREGANATVTGSVLARAVAAAGGQIEKAGEDAEVTEQVVVETKK